jgi:dihydrofolate synthase/folylpolyglutamate synthase
MASRTLADWLEWQERLNPAEIDLGLVRMHQLVERLAIHPPPGRVFMVAGTNGKGTCAAVIAGVLRAAGHRVGVYSSPHLVRYNERVTIDGAVASDAKLVDAFERIEALRGDIPLTYFEFGTLAAWLVFGAGDADVWVLEIGLGGRLDAVNAIDADYAVITTIGLDHQEWLGNSIEAIAAEKAGIMRSGCPVFFGDVRVPAAIRRVADETGARLACLGQEFGFAIDLPRWSWRGQAVQLGALALPEPATVAQLSNISTALAAVEAYDPEALRVPDLGTRVPGYARLPGRFQRHRDGHEWVLDVAHNEQAAATLRDGLEQLPSAPTTVVLGMFADKNAAAFVTALAGVAERWIVCSVDTARGQSAAELAALVEPVLDQPCATAGDPVTAFGLARERTPAGGRIVVCGSFRVVGPALDWLGLY